MRHARDYVWLLIGAVAAIALPLSGLGHALAESLSGLIPLPWGKVGIAVVVFGAASALHFRLQLMRSLADHDSDLERQEAASRLVLSAVADGKRWLLVIQENLEIVDSDQLKSQDRLYLEGARAHADKLEQAFERIEGNLRELGRRVP